MVSHRSACLTGRSIRRTALIAGVAATSTRPCQIFDRVRGQGFLLRQETNRDLGLRETPEPSEDFFQFNRSALVSPFGPRRFSLILFLFSRWDVAKADLYGYEADVYRNQLDSFIRHRRSRRQKKRKERVAPPRWAEHSPNPKGGRVNSGRSLGWIGSSGP